MPQLGVPSPKNLNSKNRLPNRKPRSSLPRHRPLEMSELIPHECGIAYVRLRKPLEYYHDKYGSALYGFQKLSLLMQKQRNRGQDGVGIGCCKIGMPHGKRYLFSEKSVKRDALRRLFQGEMNRFQDLTEEHKINPLVPSTVKEHFDYGGENLVGHLRYTTSGGASETFCHPQVRESNWSTKSLLMLGNFNMTNMRRLKQTMIGRGQHPFHDTDTQVVLEEIGYHLDEAHTDIYREKRDQGIPGEEIPAIISDEIDIVEIIRESAQVWDGGYTLVGLVGNGDGFVLRDPNGIRPCFYFADDELIVFASERAPLMTIFGKSIEQVEELSPGHVASIRHDGEFKIEPFTDPRPPTQCSFERIYFSRGNDRDIYRERKALGANLVPQVVSAIDHDFENTVFSFIPNTAEIGYLGMLEALEQFHRREVRDQLKDAQADGSLTGDLIEKLMTHGWPRGEKLAGKDEKFRTFISKEEGRNELVSFAYDITYGIVKDHQDNLVALDDSIVRGTTLRESIIKILARTKPKKIVIVSSAPQIRYPDCYGIDMSELGKFLAFQAAIALLKKRGKGRLVREVYENCLAEIEKPVAEKQNCVKAIYEPFSPEEISAEMALAVTPLDMTWDGEVELIFQSLENLHAAIPNHRGDWYFSGDYPTPGGFAVVNQAFINYFEGRDGRPYDGWL